MATNQEKFDKLCADVAFIRAVGVANQKRIDLIPDKVWRGTTVTRADKKVPVLQELADAKSLGLEHAATIAALTSLVSQLAQGQTIDYARIQADTRKVIAEETVKVQVTVSGEEAA